MNAKLRIIRLIAGTCTVFVLGIASGQSELNKRLFAENRQFVYNALLAASSCRATIAEAYAEASKGPTPRRNAWGCEGGQTKYARIETSADGAIFVNLTDAVLNEEIGGRIITLVPISKGTPTRWTGGNINVDSWRCADPKDLRKGMKMVARMYLPEGCRR